MMQILKTSVMGLPKHCQAFGPEGCMCPTFKDSLSHTNNCQLHRAITFLSTNLSEIITQFKFIQVKKSDSYDRVSQLTF